MVSLFDQYAKIYSGRKRLVQTSVCAGELIYFPPIYVYISLFTAGGGGGLFPLLIKLSCALGFKSFILCRMGHDLSRTETVCVFRKKGIYCPHFKEF